MALGILHEPPSKEGGMLRHTPQFTIRIPYEGAVDSAAESKRLQKDLDGLVKQETSLESQLGNAEFLERAPKQVVEGMRAVKLTENKAQQKKIRESMAVTRLMSADEAKIHRLLDLLTDHPTVVLSGTKMASEIGVPRSTLRGWVLRLRDLGVELQGVPAEGYRLARMPELLTPRAIYRAAQEYAIRVARATSFPKPARR